MMDFFGAQICEGGDIIASIDEFFVNDKFCSKCGAPILTECPECGATLHGDKNTEYCCEEYELPKYCYSCGKPYPWTKAAIETVSELIKMENEIDEEEKELAIISLPDVINESPKTTLATVRLQTLASKSGKFIADGIRQFAIDFGCELAKKMFGLD